MKDARGTDAEAFPGASERKITIETMGYTPLILPYFSGREAAQGATNPAIEIADLKFQGGLTDTQRTGLAAWRTTRLANTARPGLYLDQCYFWHGYDYEGGCGGSWDDCPSDATLYDGPWRDEWRYGRYDSAC